MNLNGSRLAFGGAGLAAVCVVVCCSVPVLMLTVPGLALLIGGLAGSFELGLVAALVLGGLTVVGAFVWRSRRGGWSQDTTCACGCRPQLIKLE